MRWKLANILALLWVLLYAPAQLWSYAVTQPTIAWRQTYTYDAMGRRVSRTTYQNEVASTTIYVSAGMQEVAEYTDSSDAAAPTKTYVYGSYVDEPVQVRVFASATTQPASTQSATTQPSYTDYYYHTNALYSVIAVSDTAGTVVERYTYDAYGQRTITDADGAPRAESILGNEIGFTGRRLDTLTNQYYFRARYYDAAQGRFISRDPLEYVDGMSLYGGYYVPNGVDPSGLMLLAVDGTGSRNFLDGDVNTGKQAAPKVGIKKDKYRSHVREFHRDYGDRPSLYIHGPHDEVIGEDSPKIHARAMDYLREYWCKDTKQPIDMVGHSRGGYIVMEVARELKDKGICCGGVLHKPVPVRFMGLYDPVDMTPGYGEAETIPSNVKKATVIFASARPGGKLDGDGYWDYSADIGVYIPTHQRSRPAFNRADNGPENANATQYSEYWLFATHSAIGGAPWGGDHPAGHSKKNDIEQSILADHLVRKDAIAAGVSINLKKWEDYGY